MPAITTPASPSRDDANATLGMTVFLGTWVMLFAALFLAYGVVRVQADVWPPPYEPRLPLGVPGLGSLVLLASGLVLRLGLRAARAGDVRVLARASVVTSGLGLVFLSLQAMGWQKLYGAGLRPGSSLYGSVFFAFTIFHALHVACGLLLLAVLAVRVWRQRSRAGDGLRTAARLTAAFWDFVTAVWILMYVTVYVL
ncbi:MAG TPA: cytochrome c oxidase subunit 3 [Polyangia bacterium]|jgi:cytochrome c oxidase subunit 3|nr:cytochrome c oxidase subunit 3 [Polyangia bacterium]